MDISQSRKLSKFVENLLFSTYSDGLLLPHKLENGKSYKINPESELTISSMNLLQNEEYLDDLVKLYKDKQYIMNNNKYNIHSIRIHPPHTSKEERINLPNPKMKNDELLKYIWPNSTTNKKKLDYVSTVWIDIGITKNAYSEQEESGEYKKGLTIHNEDWIRILDIPCMVGSSKCNLAAIRSYLNDDREMIDPETKAKTTYSERAKYILNELLKCEINLPDGYFIVDGKNMKCSTKDKLQMNIIYVTPKSTSETLNPVKGLITEIRSVHVLYNISTVKMYLLYTGDKKMSELYKFYSSVVMVNIASGLRFDLNIFDLAELIGIYYGREPGEGAEILLNLINILKDNQYVRIVSNYTYQQRSTLLNPYSEDMLIELFKQPDASKIKKSKKYKPITLRVYTLDEFMREKIFPHCEIDDNEEKILMYKFYTLALMFITHILAVYEDRMIDKADYSLKRWTTYGQHMKEILRGALSEGYNTKKISIVTTAMKNNKLPSNYHIKNIQKDNKMAGIVEELPKFNKISMIDAVQSVKIIASGKGGKRQSSSAMIHSSQWGQQCFVNTPEGKNIGFNNNSTEVALITNDLYPEEYDKVREIIENTKDGNYLLIFDGVPMRFVDGQLYNNILSVRRKGEINYGVGISRYFIFDTIPVINIRTFGSRIIFPMFNLHKGIDNIYSIMNRNITDFTELLESGDVEYVDGHELVHNCKVAEWIHVAENGIHTHAMIKPQHIMSTTTNCLSFIEHNPAARGTYATVHLKQAIARPYKYQEERFDHDIMYLKNPEMPIVSTDTMRRINDPIGFNLNIACMSNYGNNDDGIHFSEDLVKSGKFEGAYYNILNIIAAPSIQNKQVYNKLVVKDGSKYVETDIIDPDFSDSIIVPYGEPFIEEIPFNKLPIPYQKKIGKNKTTPIYELKEGHYYIRHGYKRSYFVQYRNLQTQELYWIDISDANKSQVIPDSVRITEKVYKTDIKPPQGRRTKWEDRICKMALVYIRKDLASTLNTPFISKETIVIDDAEYYYAAKSNVPRITNNSSTIAQLMTIRKKRYVKRGDTAMKILERDKDTNDIIKIKKEKFEITYGTVEDIITDAGVRIKSKMPLFIKPGNKYAAPYAQKSVCARIVPSHEMPIYRYLNKETGKIEEKRFDAVFNPLSFPSRMTIGMEYEIFIAGTLSYLWNIKNLKDMYENNRNEFDIYMKDKYNVDNASELIDELKDSTPFIYDNMEKKNKCYNLRKQLNEVHGNIPPDGLYPLSILDNDSFLANTIKEMFKREVEEKSLIDLYSDEPEEFNRILKDLIGINLTKEDIKARKLTVTDALKIRSFLGIENTDDDYIEIENPINCGTVYYIAQRHIVDNKKRARGYIGKKDPVTQQPVKGRRKNGGASFGTQENDAVKSHGASAFLHERMAIVSDEMRFLKCPICGGLVQKGETRPIKYTCIECKEIIPADKVIIHDSVVSWLLLKEYCRGLGIDIKEYFE